MRRTEQAQRLRLMKFEEVDGRTRRGVLCQTVRRRERPRADTNPAGTRGAGWRINKPKDMRGQEVVAPS